MNRKDDESIPFLPEEKNPVFYIYPMCIIMSMVFAILWFFTNVLTKRPQIALIGCFVAAICLLSAGITEMKHADMYLDLTKIKDEELLTNPIFIHNFIMCLVSIFGMIIYLLQGWIIMDYWLQIKEQGHVGDVSNDNENSERSGESGHQSQKVIDKRKDKIKEEPGELDPIPALDKFPSLTLISQPESISEEPVILYCCFFDCYKYIKHEYFTERPVHEFQVVHVM